MFSSRGIVLASGARSLTANAGLGVAMAGALGLCAVFHLWGAARARLITVLCAVVVVFVGVSRVVLNVHNPTDVLAGWLLGGLWFLVCLPLLSHGRFKAPADSPVPGRRPIVPKS